jgi:hypothetical protein
MKIGELKNKIKQTKMGKLTEDVEFLRLTEKQVVNIVMEWYTNGMCTDIFQNEDGLDLEEWCEKRLYSDRYGEKLDNSSLD